MNPDDIRAILEKKPKKESETDLKLLILAIAIVFLGIVVNFFVFFLLYNFVMPAFGFPKLNFWHTTALFTLIWMFIGPIRLKNK